MESRDISRFFFSGATDAVPDPQGRILIPPKLRAHAHLEKEITFLGVNNRMEIWDSTAWNKAGETFDEAALELQMAKLGL